MSLAAIRVYMSLLLLSHLQMNNTLFLLDQTVNSEKSWTVSPYDFSLCRHSGGCWNETNTGRCKSLAKNEKLCCELGPKVFLLLHIYLLNEKEPHTDALNKKYYIAELQVLFIKVISWLLPFSFSFLLCYYSFQNENSIFSASYVEMTTASNLCRQQALKTISSIIFTVKIP